MPIVFGSPEAMKILEIDKNFREIGNGDLVDGLQKTLRHIESDIESVEQELSILYGERTHIQEQLAKLGALTK